MRFDVTVRQYAVSGVDACATDTASLTLFAADLDALVQKLVSLFGLFDDADMIGHQHIILFRSPDDELATEVRMPV